LLAQEGTPLYCPAGAELLLPYTPAQTPFRLNFPYRCPEPALKMIAFEYKIQ
jgi:hypothetical protein